MDDTGQKTTLGKILKDSMYVYHFSKMQCEDCIKTQLSLMTKHLKISPSKMIIITDYNTSRDIKIFRNVYHVPYRTFLTNTPTGIEADSMESPYFYRVGKKYQISEIFMPIKEYTDLSVAFFNKISEKQP